MITTQEACPDLQQVSLTLRVMSRPDVQHLSTIYKTLGADYDERVLPSIGNEVLKATVAQFDAAELITQREIVSSRIREDLLKRAREFNILLDDVSLVRQCRPSIAKAQTLTSRCHCRRILPSERSSHRRLSRSKSLSRVSLILHSCIIKI